MYIKLKIVIQYLIKSDSLSKSKNIKKVLLVIKMMLDRLLRN